MCLQILGAVASAAGTLMAASHSSKAMKARARVQERQAEVERDAGAYRMSRMRREQKRMLGSQIAAGSARGLGRGSGSLTASLDDSLSESELDIEAVRYSADQRAASQQSQAALSRANARAALSAGTFKALSPLIQAGGGAVIKAGRRAVIKGGF